MAELKPCKCGIVHKVNSEINSRSRTSRLYWIFCDECDMYASAETEEKAIASWNEYADMYKEEQNNQNEPLKSCPFCHKDSAIHVEKETEEWFVCCCDCGATGPYKPTKAAAIDAWNKSS